MEDWLVHLEDGDPEAAWDAFLSRYRRLIFATIRHQVRDQDLVMDLFAAVCEALRVDDLARLRRYGEGPKTARFSTWLVVVVRNLAIDALRSLRGRPRPPALADRLPPIQRQILKLVFVDGWGHREAYERLRSDHGDLSFGQFLRELADVYRAAQGVRGLRIGGPVFTAPPPAPPGDLNVVERQRQTVLDRALASLPAEDGAVVRLYVMEGLSASEVARLLDLPNAKAVYNRVYRALTALRTHLREAGYQHAHDL